MVGWNGRTSTTIFNNGTSKVEEDNVEGFSSKQIITPLNQCV